MCEYIGLSVKLSVCVHVCVCGCMNVDVGVSGPEHYTFSPLVCLTVVQPRQTRQSASSLVETTPVCPQTTSTRVDSLCTCLSVRLQLLTKNISFNFRRIFPWLSHTHLSISVIDKLKYSLILTVWLPDPSYQYGRVLQTDFLIYSDTTSH